MAGEAKFHEYSRGCLYRLIEFPASIFSQGGAGFGYCVNCSDFIMDLVSGLYYYIQDRKTSPCGRSRTEKRGIFHAVPVQPWLDCISLLSTSRKMDSFWYPGSLVYRTVYVPLVLYDLWRK